MATKLLPDVVKATVRNGFKSKSRRPSAALSEAVRRQFAEWGRQGYRKAKSKLTKDVLVQAGKKGGRTRIKNICAELGVDYAKLPDAPLVSTKSETCTINQKNT